MRLFLDTEFTDLLNADLISIGLVSDDGREFYAERSDFDTSACSEFVKLAVLPRLQGPAATEEEIGAALQKWLFQFESVEVCFDHGFDWEFFFSLVRDPNSFTLPTGVVGLNIKKVIDPVDLERYWVEHGRMDHHALQDARANQYAFHAALKRGTPPPGNE